MYEINGVYYAGKCENGIKVETAKVLMGGMMLITFNTGEKRIFDTTTLKEPVFLPLRDENILNNFTIFHGVITWNEGQIDIAPETLYYDSMEYDAAATFL